MPSRSCEPAAFPMSLGNARLREDLGDAWHPVPSVLELWDRWGKKGVCLLTSPALLHPLSLLQEQVPLWPERCAVAWCTEPLEQRI